MVMPPITAMIADDTTSDDPRQAGRTPSGQTRLVIPA
jgi:hypothetical protein